MKNKSGGFTLIELVIVIVILGILAATALPRFVDIGSDAHRAAVQGVQGGFASGIALARSKYLAGGATGNTVVLETGIPAIPVVAGVGLPSAANNAQCNNLFRTLLPTGPMTQAGNPNNATQDWTAHWAAPYCIYTYRKDGVAAGSRMGFSYTFAGDPGNNVAPGMVTYRNDL